MTNGLPPQFASDNYAGICPEAWRALDSANTGHAPAYGADDWTRAASAAIERLFETACDVFFAFNGTAANSLALAAICRNTDAIVCHALAHINVDECGAPEFMSGGAKLLTIESPDAKLTPDAVGAAAVTPHDEHSSRPRALALTQATELGTVYLPDEIAALCKVAHGRKMKVQMDGARFANAVASLGCSPADLTWRAGVDVLCLGGTKNGLPAGEAIVFFDRDLAEEFARRPSRPASSRRRCDSWQHLGSACSRTVRGSGMRRTRTPWRSGWHKACLRSRRRACLHRCRRTAYSSICRNTPSTRCARRVGDSMPSSAKRACA
jgi:threonine aldolase